MSSAQTPKNRLDPESDRAPLTPKGRKRYNELVRGAARAFRRSGYDAATIQEIARTAGMKTASLYHYVDSKEDLLFAVIQVFHEGTKRVMRLLDDAQDRDPVTLLTIFVREHILEQTTNIDGGVVFNNEFRSLTGSHREEVLWQRREYEMKLREILRSGQETGQFKTLSASLMAKGILGMINGILDWYRPDGPLLVDGIIDQYVSMVLNSVGASSRSGS